MNPDVVLIQETKLTDDNVITVPGFQWFGNNRKFKKKGAKCGSGGVGILIRNSVANNYDIEVVDKSLDGILILTMIHKDNDHRIAVGSIYLPPEAGEYGKKSDTFFNHLLNQAYILTDMDLFLLGGDLNARINTDGDYISGVDDVPPRRIIDMCKNKHGDSFIDFLLDSKMCIINGRVDIPNDNFTSISKKGKAVVDYFFCPYENLTDVAQFEVHSITDLVNKFNMSPGKLPDHSLLYCILKTSHCIETKSLNNTQTDKLYQTRQGFKYKREIPADFLGEHMVNLINDTISRIEKNVKSQFDIDMLYNELCEIYYKEMESKLKKKHATRCKGNRQGKPWWSKDLENLWSEVTKSEKMFTKAKGKPRKELYSKFKDIRSKFDRCYNKAKRLYLRSERETIAQLNTEDPKAFWDKIKHMGPSKDNKIPMEIPADDLETITDVNLVLKQWQNDFENLYNRVNSDGANEEFLKEVMSFKETFEREHPLDDPISDNNILFNSVITIEEVHRAIFKAKNNKAIGIDELPNEVFKNPNSIRLWQSFFNECFNTGLTPELWSKALIKPIPKGGNLDKRIPLNYRGISLLSTISKIYSAILNERLLTFLEANNLISDTQNGFRKLRSCIDHLFVLTSIIRNRKVNGLSTFVCYIDLAKAFDTVDRDCLFMKLANAGIQGKMYWAIRSLYCNHVSSILVNDYQTDWFSNITGVKQGDNISTTLFALYLNDLAEIILNSGKGVKLNDNLSVQILMYADDIALVSENEQNLQDMINIVYDWCSQWGMKLNVEKSKIVHYRKKTIECSKFNFLYGQNILAYSSEYKYLGCTLSEHLDYTPTADILAKASSRALSSVLSKYKEFKGLDYNSYSKLYKSCICTVMDYSSAIWGFKQYDKIDTVHNRAMRAFLGVHRFTSVPAISGDMAWLTPKSRRHLEIVRFWLRLSEMDDSRLTKKVYLWDKGRTKGSWTKDVNHILKEHNLEHLICDEPLAVLSKSEILRLVEESLKSKQVERWEQDIHSQSKLRFYRLFKNVYEVEKYVSINLTISQRSILSQLRYGILPLKVETGRYSNMPVEDRICQFCETNEVETELHFLFDCNRYSAIRESFYIAMNTLSQNFTTSSNEDKLKLLFSQSNFIRKFANYVNDCYKMRSSVLFN